MNRILVRLLSLALVVSVAQPLQAQFGEVDRLFGQGVHAFHQGLPMDSLVALDQAVELGTRDPRVYYYRGAVKALMGQTDAASADFSLGAEFEFNSTGRFYSVNRALERLQGPVRLEIETHRQVARVAAFQKPVPPGGPAETANLIPVVPDPLPHSTSRPQINFPDTTGRNYPNVPWSPAPGARPGDAPSTTPVPGEGTDELFPATDPAEGDEPAPEEPPADGDEAAPDMPPAEGDAPAGDPAPEDQGNEPADDDAPEEPDAPPADEPADGNQGGEGEDDDPFNDGN